MYNIILRRVFMNTPAVNTAKVKYLREALEHLPDDMEILCCGTDRVWLHVDDKNNICSFDYDDLSEEYAE